MLPRRFPRGALVAAIATASLSVAVTVGTGSAHPTPEDDAFIGIVKQLNIPVPSPDDAVQASGRELVTFGGTRSHRLRTDEARLGQPAGQTSDRLRGDTQDPGQSHTAGHRVTEDRTQRDVLAHRDPRRTQGKIRLQLEQMRGQND